MISDPQIFQLFRGRPYTKTVPFTLQFAGVAGQTALIWKPNNAYFEFAGGIIISTVAGPTEYQLCDGNVNNPFTAVLATNADYKDIRIGELAGYRSVGPPGNGPLLLVDTAGVAATVRGFVWIWEVDGATGYYR